MPRTADQIFLKLAVQQGALTPEDAGDIQAELDRLEADGSPSKARILCLELGFMDEAHARQLKQEVRGHLEKKEREVEVDSRSERRIAGFELLERLGSGAMGVVFKARHLKLNKIVALKLLNPDFAQEERSVARFLQEAQVAAALNHANIVQAYDVGQAGDVHYIAMEFVDGKTVKELIERRGQLDEQAAIEIVLQVLDALKHAHSRSLIHRDVKPANIMITREGQAKLLDLGLARRTDVESGLTGEGRAIGTPYFMAPEQALDKGADYRADIYALGATFYNMVTGAKPYVAGTPVAVMNMHLKAPIPDAHQANAKVSKGLAKIISKMLAKRPSDRYQDHDALIKDLEAVLGGLMPDLDGGRPPDGVDCISRPQAGAAIAPRSRPQRGAAGATTGKPGMLVIGGAAAACLLLGVGFLAHARSNPSSTRVSDGTPVDDAPDTTETPFDRERAAKAALAEINRTPARPEQRQAVADQVAEFENVYQQFPETEAGKRAAQEAQRLLRALDNDEQARLDSRRTQLDALVAQGKLQEALAGFEELVASLEDMRLRSEADASANQVRIKIQAKLDEIQKEVDGLARSGREREAAVALRRALSLLSPDKRARLLTKIDELEGLAAGKEAEARARLRRAEAEHAEEDEKRLSLLAGQLIELVAAGKVHDAQTTAAEATTATITPALKAKAQLHHDALTAIVALEALATQSFEKLVGQKVELERRRGAKIEGEVTRVQGDKLAIAVLSRAELLIGAADLSDDELLRVIRRGFNATHPPYVHGVAALRLYQGAADADAAVERAREAGFDLTGVQDDLRAARERASDAGLVGDARPAGSPDEPGVADASTADEDRRRREDEEARLRMERDRRLFENRERLFPEAETGGLDGTQLGLIYVYFTNSRDFGEDWKRISGKSQLLPPGANDRIGLVLEGDNGRAQFTAPLTGDFKIEVEFMSQLFGKEGRFAITVDTENQRVESNLGELVYQRRRRVQRAGENMRGSIRQQRRHTLELSRAGDTITTKFDGTVTGSVNVETFEKTRLGLEWGNASLNLAQIKMRFSPESEWLEKKLAPQ